MFFVDAATAAAAVLIMSTIDAPPHPKESIQAGYLSNLFDGLQYVQQSFVGQVLLIYYALFMFLITPAAFLTPLLIARSFGGEVWRLTANEMLFGGGLCWEDDHRGMGWLQEPDAHPGAGRHHVRASYGCAGVGWSSGCIWR